MTRPIPPRRQIELNRRQDRVGHAAARSAVGMGWRCLQRRFGRPQVRISVVHDAVNHVLAETGAASGRFGLVWTG